VLIQPPPAAMQASGTGAAAQTAEDVSTHPDYKKGLALIGQSDCLGCHKVSEKMTGPAYQEVAERYAGKPGIEDSLASKIINGGSGNWGDQMMTPHPNLSKEDAVSMVKYILLLKDQK
jgi:cytochrome c